MSLINIPRGLGRGLVETPGHVAMRERLGAMYGRSGFPTPDKPVKPDPYALPTPAAGEEGAEPPSTSLFGGGKLSGRDFLGLALSAVGDVFTRQGGGSGGQSMMPLYMSGLMSRRSAETAARKAQQIQADLKAQGYTDEEARLMALNPQAIGTNMAERTGAYTMNKGDVRMNGNNVVAERQDMFETPTGDRYNVDRNGKTTQIYREESPIYQSVDGVGVFGMDRHRPGVMDTSGPASGGAPPARAIEALQADPSRAAEFDVKFGAGAAQRYLGGGGGNATGGFPSNIPSGSPLDPPRFRR